MIKAFIISIWRLLLVVGIIYTTIKLVELINKSEGEESMDFTSNQLVRAFSVVLPKDATIVRI
jgi:hypothetical protein